MNEAIDATNETEPEQPVAVGVSLLELRDGMCKFPIYGTLDTRYLFCGDSAGAHVYCPFHRKIAYNSAPASQRR